jgi:hypothetical protein
MLPVAAPGSRTVTSGLDLTSWTSGSVAWRHALAVRIAWLTGVPGRWWARSAAS